MSTQVLKISKAGVSITLLGHLFQGCATSWWNTSWSPAWTSQNLNRYRVKWKSHWVSVSLNFIQSCGLRLLWQTLWKFTVFHRHGAIIVTFAMRCSELDSTMDSLPCAENVALLVTEQCMPEKWKVGKFAPIGILKWISSTHLLEKKSLMFKSSRAQKCTFISVHWVKPPVTYFKHTILCQWTPRSRAVVCTVSAYWKGLHRYQYIFK